MADSSLLALSVILAAPDRHETIRGTIKHLRSQTVSDMLEVVIVAPSEDALGDDDSELRAFRRYRVVEVGEISSIAQAYGAGIRQASAPVVVLAEDHSFPDDGWAGALIEAHKKPWAAVGPVVRNANPDSMVSWANFLISYAPWLDPAPSGVANQLPGHNSSYKRAVLLDYGPALEVMLEAETVLHWDLAAKGHQLYLEPAAKTSHVNFEVFSVWMREQYHSGRVFAAARSRRWSFRRRFLYAGAGPLIPLVRIRRIVRELRRPGRPHHLIPAILPVLMLGLALSAAGETIGYVLGAGDAAHRIRKLECRRVRHPIEGAEQQQLE
ncbi:MAG: glycosyltransferase [Anaerolineae bacterium]|nr:glycosyltransferase [Anaerolineae bacterium]